MFKKTVFIALLSVYLGGCHAVYVKDIRSVNAYRIKKLHAGITKDEVLDIMGSYSETIQAEVYFRGYLVGYRDMVVSNPYKAEVEWLGEKTYEIIYYLADIHPMMLGYWEKAYAERRVRDDMLTPLLFHDGILIGIGWEIMEDYGLVEKEEQDQDYWFIWSS
jgi:hypothetical protein